MILANSPIQLCQYPILFSKEIRMIKTIVKGNRDREAGEYIGSGMRCGKYRRQYSRRACILLREIGTRVRDRNFQCPRKTCARVFLFHNPFRGPSRAPIFWQDREHEKGFNERDWILSAGKRNSGNETLVEILVETLGTPLGRINTINLDGKHDSYYRYSPSLPSRHSQ